MKRKYATLTILFLALLFSEFAAGQNDRTRSAGPAQGSPCRLEGAYRIDVEASDRLYSVVRGATSSVPFGDQQRFFMDLSVRLTPPDILAIECRGRNVTVGSSRAPKMTFLADGRLRQERTPDGSTVYSRVSLDGNALTFTSTGRATDNVNVVFRPLNGGRRLHVTRHIYAEQLTQPIVIRTYYDKVADRVNWDNYGDALVARSSQPDDHSIASTGTPRVRATTGVSSEVRVLRRSLDEWIEATNDRDIDRQMRYYVARLQAFYLTRNTPSTAVRAEKQRAFKNARSIEINAEEPEIVFQDGGRTAVMRFRKKYRIIERSRARAGEVVQELRWRRTADGWRIFSERDVRVIR